MSSLEMVKKVELVVACLVPERAAEISPDVQLFVSGIIDSFATIGLIAQLEKEFSIRLSNEDLTLENFSTINAIADLMERRRSPK